MQAAEQAQIESEAKLIAFDRQNHMGISSKTAKKIQDAITAEAATMHDAKGAKAVVSIKENEEKMKQLRVRRLEKGERGIQLLFKFGFHPGGLAAGEITGSLWSICSPGAMCVHQQQRQYWVADL